MPFGLVALVKKPIKMRFAKVGTGPASFDALDAFDAFDACGPVATLLRHWLKPKKIKYPLP